MMAFKETIAAGFEPVATLAKGHILEHMKQAKEKAAAQQGAQWPAVRAAARAATLGGRAANADGTATASLARRAPMQ